MKSARRNITLAAVAALTLAAAPSALADVRIHLSLPLPPPPHKVLRHLPVPPPPPAIVVSPYAGRWNYTNRHRNDYWVWADSRWVYPPYPGAVWVEGYRGPHGHWVTGYWKHPNRGRGHAGYGRSPHGHPKHGNYR
jgi:hypothetical protein